MVAVTRDGANVRAALVHVDGGLVVCVDDAGGAEGAEGLREHVDWEFAPWKLAEHAVGEGDSRVEVPAGFAAAVDAEHNS